MDWTAKQDKALSMISKYGTDIRLVVESRSAYNPTLDSFTLSTTSYTAKGLFTQFSERDINGTTIQAGDRKLLIPAKNLPNLDEAQSLKVYFNGVKLDPMLIDPLMPGGTRIIYTMQVRA